MKYMNLFLKHMHLHMHMAIFIVKTWGHDLILLLLLSLQQPLDDPLTALLPQAELQLVTCAVPPHYKGPQDDI